MDINLQLKKRRELIEKQKSHQRTKVIRQYKQQVANDTTINNNLKDTNEKLFPDELFEGYVDDLIQTGAYRNKDKYDTVTLPVEKVVTIVPGETVVIYEYDLLSNILGINEPPGPDSPNPTDSSDDTENPDTSKLSYTFVGLLGLIGIAIVIKNRRKIFKI